MSKYSHLPIYVEANNILREFYNRIPKFDKQYKYFLGGKLIEYCANNVVYIMEINKMPMLAPLIGEELHLETVIRYVEKNPLIANLVSHILDWGYSSLSQNI